MQHGHVRKKIIVDPLHTPPAPQVPPLGHNPGARTKILYKMFLLFVRKHTKFQNINNYGHCLKFMYIKFVFEVTKYIQNGSKWPLTTNHHFICNIYKTVSLQNRISFGILMLASSTWLRVLVLMEGFPIG